MNEPRDWLDAAQQATFKMYELATPNPSARQSDRYGWDDEGISSLAACFAHDGGTTELEIERDGSAFSDEDLLRNIVLDLLVTRVSDDQLVELPLELRIDSVDIEIDVDGKMCRFMGAEMGDVWTGSAVIDRQVRITVNSPADHKPKSFIVCKDFETFTDDP